MTSKNTVPKYGELAAVTFSALKTLGGSGKNDEINEKSAEILALPDEILEIPHLDSSSLSEVNYRLAWARTLLKKHGAITNSVRGVWSITPEFSNIDTVDGNVIEKAHHRAPSAQKDILPKDDPDEIPEEVRSWRKKLYDVLVAMDPFAFERLAQRVLRECGFTQVEVTKKPETAVLMEPGNCASMVSLAST